MLLHDEYFKTCHSFFLFCIVSSFTGEVGKLDNDIISFDKIIGEEYSYKPEKCFTERNLGTITLYDSASFSKSICEIDSISTKLKEERVLFPGYILFPGERFDVVKLVNILIIKFYLEYPDPHVSNKVSIKYLDAVLAKLKTLDNINFSKFNKLVYLYNYMFGEGTFGVDFTKYALCDLSDDIDLYRVNKNNIDSMLSIYPDNYCLRSEKHIMVIDSIWNVILGDCGLR